MGGANANSRYCPSTVPATPLANAVYNTSETVRFAWNSKWGPFVAASDLDVYVCPTQKPSACVKLGDKVPVSAEFIDAKLNNLSSGRYVYLVISAGSAPGTQFGDRGTEFSVNGMMHFSYWIWLFFCRVLPLGSDLVVNYCF
jgi:hypothetical protein